MTAGAAGNALGLLADSAYTTTRTPIDDGTLVFLFTDGIVEATNPAHEEFGTGRLTTVVRENLGAGLSTLAENVLTEVIAFTCCSAFTDDICFVVMDTDAIFQAKHAAGFAPEKDRRG